MGTKLDGGRSLSFHVGLGFQRLIPPMSEAKRSEFDQSGSGNGPCPCFPNYFDKAYERISNFLSRTVLRVLCFVFMVRVSREGGGILKIKIFDF